MLSIQSLDFGYKKGRPLLSDINLNLEKGKIYGLFGLNGVGKTTLLNNIAGMLFPTSGSCVLEGDETKYRKPEVMSKLFIVPEQFDLTRITGQKHIELHAPFYPDFDDALMQKILSEFEIKTSKKLTELSFGQRKKFLIAFGIATQAELLIFDEPTNGLDIPSKSQFRKIVASLDVGSRCILISTHQVRDLGSMIDHIVVLKDESIVFNQTVEEIENKLSIQKIASDENQEYFYGEEVFGGVKAVVPKSKTATSEMDFEILFNGIIQKTAEINKHFEV